MILYLVNQHGRVFQTYSYRNTFGFHFYTIIIQPLIYIPCGVSGSQNNRSFESLSGICLYTCDFVFSMIRESIRVSKCTSPPHSMMVFRMFSITRGSLSVPMCGWASTKWRYWHHVDRIHSEFCLHYPAFCFGYRAYHLNRLLLLLLRNYNYFRSQLCAHG